MTEAAPLAIVHVISHLGWQREGLDTFETARARLLDTLASLLRQMDSTETSNPLTHVLLNGQTVVLEDIAAVRADLLALLVIHNARGRLGLGPWYVQVDESLVSGESLIRNLLAARADAQQHGAKLLTVADAAESTSHAAQLPQILRGFGVDAVLVRYAAPVAHLPFRWEAPDGSSILAVSHDFRADPQTAQSPLKEQKMLEPDGPLLWMREVSGETDPFDSVERDGDTPLSQSTLPDYVKALRQSLPDALRPALRGELRLQTLRPYAYLQPGVLSTRLYLKQANAQMQSRLTYAAEPWLAIALTHGAKVDFPENLRALLHYAWRTLLKNQLRNALAGVSDDSVHDQNESRFQQVEDLSTHIIAQAQRALPGTPGMSIQGEETYLVVWNPHNRQMRHVVEIELKLSPEQYPARLITPEGENIVFGWQPFMRRLSFSAEAPPVGYAVYTLHLSEDMPPDGWLTARVDDHVIGNAFGERLTADNEQLTWTRGTQSLTNVLRFFDGGDAGDAYNYSPPDPDVIAQAVLSSDAKIETSPVYQRLVMNYRVRVAPALRLSRGRDRGVKLLELTTSATFYEGTPGIFFSTTFTNNVADHRLRAHLQTGVESDYVIADSAFALVKRPLSYEGIALPDAPNVEGILNTYAMQSVAAVENADSAMALLTRGLPEFEAIEEDGQTTLALTLLRSVGWLSRSDLRSRTGSVNSTIAVQGAQGYRPVHAEFALLPMTPNDPARLLSAGLGYNTPLQISQYMERPPILHHSYLLLEGAGSQQVILTALKPPQIGNGWIVRLLNPTDTPIEINIVTEPMPQVVERVNLAEELQQIIEADDSGAIKIQLDPQKIVTVRLGFE